MDENSNEKPKETIFATNGSKIEIFKNGRVIMHDRKGGTFRQNIVDGILIPPFNNGVHNVRNKEKIIPRLDDVFISAYSRCGTHWVYEIMQMLLRNDVNYVYDDKDDAFLEMAKIKDIDKMSSPRLLNSHLHPQFINPDVIQQSKFVFITRNPKDVEVSVYYHMKYYVPEFTNSFSDFFEVMNADFPKITVDTWIAFTVAWQKYFDEHPNLQVLYLYYEDLKEDLQREVHRIAEYLDIDASNYLIRQIAEKCQFDQMSKGKVAKDEHQQHAFRSGKVGGWKHYYTVAMSERIDQRLLEELPNSKIVQKIRYTL